MAQTKTKNKLDKIISFLLSEEEKIHYESFVLNNSVRPWKFNQLAI